MIVALESLFIFLTVIAGGVLLEFGVSKLHHRVSGKRYKEHHVVFSKYLFPLFLVLTTIVLVAEEAGLTLVSAFLLFSGLGMVLEWLVGFSYHKIVGQKLWTYHLYTITEYSSLISVFIWGLTGVLFLFFAQIAHSLSSLLSS